MPVIAPVPPNKLKEVLELDGWKIFDEDQYNWLLEKDLQSLAIPKKPAMTSVEVLEHTLSKAELAPGDFFSLLKQTGFSYHGEQDTTTSATGLTPN